MSQFVFNCPDCNKSIVSDDSRCGELRICHNCNNYISTPIPGIKPNVKFGDFELIELIGTGSTGEVWKAQQISINRIVALKILFPKHTNNKNFVTYFRQEAKQTTQLSHPMIVSIYFYGLENELYFIAMSYIEGISIYKKFKKGKIYTEREALKIIKDISSALAYMCNNFKMIHKNINPQNILIDKNGKPMLLVLEITKTRNKNTLLSIQEMTTYPPYFMSPEQGKNDKKINFRADIYSLGCSFFYILTGRVPYFGNNSIDIMLKHLKKPIPSPRKINPYISANTEKIIKKMMAKNSAKRYQSWENLIEDINRVLKHKELKYAKERPKASKTSINFIAIFISTIILGCIAGGIFYINKKKESKQIKPEPSNIQTNSQQNKIEKTIPIEENNTTTKIPANKQFIDDISEKNSEINTAQKGEIHEVVKKNQQSKPMIKVIETENTKDNTTLEPNDDSQIDDNANYFQTVAANLDVKKHSPEEIKSYWNNIVGKRYKWAGKITYYMNTENNEYEIRVAIPGAKVFDNYNIILHLKTNKEMKKLKKKHIIVFEGEVYNKQLIKGTGAVILHLKKIKNLSIY